MKCFRLWLFYGIILIVSIKGDAQAIGGNSVYNFLRIPYSAKATALGGINISTLNSDLGLAMYQPALYDETMDGQINVGVKPFFAGIQQYDVNTVRYNKQRKFFQGLGVHYMNYGNIDMFDAAGNALGMMQPNEYAIQYAHAIIYKEYFTLGSNIKYIHSNYGIYRSDAIGLDVSINYMAPSGLSQFSILVNNIGTQLKTFGVKENLPFNITMGWSHKLANAPFIFSLTAQRLSIWDQNYNDPVFNNLEGISSSASSKNILNHLITSTEVLLGQSFKLGLGYNFLRRNELNIANQKNFLNGFSSGFEVNARRVTVQYGNAFYQNNSYHHFGLIYNLKKNN